MWNARGIQHHASFPARQTHLVSGRPNRSIENTGAYKNYARVFLSWYRCRRQSETALGHGLVLQVRRVRRHECRPSRKSCFGIERVQRCKLQSTPRISRCGTGNDRAIFEAVGFVSDQVAVAPRRIDSTRPRVQKYTRAYRVYV